MIRAAAFPQTQFVSGRGCDSKTDLARRLAPSWLRRCLPSWRCLCCCFAGFARLKPAATIARSGALYRGIPHGRDESARTRGQDAGWKPAPRARTRGQDAGWKPAPRARTRTRSALRQISTQSRARSRAAMPRSCLWISASDPTYFTCGFGSGRSPDGLGRAAFASLRREFPDLSPKGERPVAVPPSLGGGGGGQAEKTGSAPFGSAKLTKKNAPRNSHEYVSRS
jgi:hypothetical protein